MKNGLKNYYLLKNTEKLIKSNNYIFFLHINSLPIKTFNNFFALSKYYKIHLVKNKNNLFKKFNQLFKFSSFFAGPSYILLTNNLKNALSIL